MSVGVTDEIEYNYQLRKTEVVEMASSIPKSCIIQEQHRKVAY